MKKIIGKIIAWLSHWEKDKVLHFSLCLIISIIAACIVKMCKGDTWIIVAAAFFAGFVTGIGKEIYDEAISEARSRRISRAVDMSGGRAKAVDV